MECTRKTMYTVCIFQENNIKCILCQYHPLRKKLLKENITYWVLELKIVNYNFRPITIKKEVRLRMLEWVKPMWLSYPPLKTNRWNCQEIVTLLWSKLPTDYHAKMKFTPKSFFPQHCDSMSLSTQFIGMTAQAVIFWDLVWENIPITTLYPL